jgi:hypothetical protein
MGSVKGAFVVTIIDLGVAGVSSFALDVGFVASLGLVLLLESAALMLIGGALSFGGQPGVRRLTWLLTGTKVEASKSDIESLDAKAATVALAGVLLFLESLALAAATA